MNLIISLVYMFLPQGLSERIRFLSVKNSVLHKIRYHMFFFVS